MTQNKRGIIFQMTGLSGAGKTTIANEVKKAIEKDGIPIKIIDGDKYRKNLCSDLGFSKEDRNENIRRLGFVANELASYGVNVIIAAINPYADIRRELSAKYNAKIVYINCPLERAIQRDTKGLYKRAMLPDDHPDKIHHMTGISDPYEFPENDFDLMISPSETQKPFHSAVPLIYMIRHHYNKQKDFGTKRALFIGRWQPFHYGHQWLIDQKLSKNIPVTIAIRDCPIDEFNPFTSEEVADMIKTVYKEADVSVIIMPDIESVNYGRGVGYEINEFVPPTDIHVISATAIRKQIQDGETSWQEKINPLIHKMIDEKLRC